MLGIISILYAILLFTLFIILYDIKKELETYKFLVKSSLEENKFINEQIKILGEYLDSNNSTFETLFSKFLDITRLLDDLRKFNNKATDEVLNSLKSLEQKISGGNIEELEKEILDIFVRNEDVDDPELNDIYFEYHTGANLTKKGNS